MPLILPALLCGKCYAAGMPVSQGSGGLWAGTVLGLLLVAGGALLSRTRIRRAQREAHRATELANHREYERNLAQQELVRRLEEERELAKEKMQFESQLSDYEKYASLAQLALGAAHEINNPLLGILSHLELEPGGRRRRTARGDRAVHRGHQAYFVGGTRACWTMRGRAR